MVQSNHRDETALRRVTDEVLHYLWDPIGAAGEPMARDEYHTYVSDVVELLEREADEARIAAYLGVVRTERMGLRPLPDKDLEVARTLLDWKDTIDARWERENIPRRNIQVIDGALNTVYDIFQATDEEFALIFPEGQDIAFIDEVMARGLEKELDEAFDRIWTRRIAKRDAMGIHGILFYELEYKKEFYPTRSDEEARNPDGTWLR
jgi:hypothetical protein